jgi:XRE family transcriptional regulator, regulator of sulfur utilization
MAELTTLESDRALAERLARNVKQLREARGATQAAMSRISKVPRATWANIESFGANPTLSVLFRVAQALNVSLEELLAEPRASCRLYEKTSLKTKARGLAIVRKLLPDPLPGMEIDRIELPPRGKLVGVPHTPGTREYLTCEEGAIELVVSGERFVVGEGDVAVFRGDQKHSYANADSKKAIGYSVVLLAAPSA